MKIFVVIPAFNEAKVIRSVVSNIHQLCHRVVVVDDASADTTKHEAVQGGAVVIRHMINRGQGAALKTGIDYSLQHGADIVVTFDADGQHDPKDMAALVQPIQEGRAEVVLGSRFLLNTFEHMPALRKFILRAGIMFTRAVSGISVTDTHNGFRAFSALALRRIRIRQDRMAHASEIFDEIVRNSLHYCEAPVTIRYSEYSLAKGQSSTAFLKILVKYFIGRLMK